MLFFTFFPPPMPIHVECHALSTMTFIIDYLVIKQTSRVGDTLLLTTMSATSDRTLRPHGKLNLLSFIILCARAVFSNKVLHGRWLPAEQATSWEQDCVLTRLLSDWRGVSLQRPIHEMGNREEPEQKQQKVHGWNKLWRRETKLLLLRLLRMKWSHFHSSRMYLAVANLVKQGVCLCQVTCCMSRIAISKRLLWNELSY